MTPSLDRTVAETAALDREQREDIYWVIRLIGAIGAIGAYRCSLRFLEDNLQSRKRVERLGENRY